MQTFRYRGARRVCLPAQLHLLHPDELHDGTPGIPEVGFSYRIAYVGPAAIQRARGSSRLPFVRDPVQACTGQATALADALYALLADLVEPMDPLRVLDPTVALTDGLWALADSVAPSPERSIDLTAVQRAWELLTDDPSRPSPPPHWKR